MKMDKFIENLLIELSYRSNEGYPQLNNPTHQTIIAEILADWDLSELSYPLIKNLLEAEGEDNDEPQSDYEHLGAGVYVRRGDKDKEGAQKYTKTDTGTFQSISDDEYEKIKAKQGDSGEKAAADTPQNQTQGGVDGDEGGEEDKTGTSLDPNTPAGKDWIGSLPKDDPARKSASDNTEVGKINKISEDNIETQNDFIENGYRKGAAPGNAGSMYNEIMSSRISEYFLENPNTSEEDAYNHIKEVEAGGKLAQQNNKSKNRPGRITSSDTNPYEGGGESNELISKRLIAIRSAKRKAEKVQIANKKLNWENTKTLNFFGDSKGLEAMADTIKSTNGIVDQNGNPISKEDALELVATSGGGENPSDTGTVIINKLTEVATILFHSDKDSTGALIAQSSFAAEIEQSERNIDSLISDGKLTPEEAQEIKNTRKEYSKKVQQTEDKLNNITSAPAKFLNEGIGNTIQTSQVINLLKNASAGADPQKYWKSQVEKRFSNPNLLLPPKDSNPRKRVSDYLPENVTDPTDEQITDAYIKWCADDSWTKSEDSLPKNDQKLINDLNTNFGGPDVLEEIDKIRRETINIQEQMINNLDNQYQFDIDKKQVGLGTYLEAQNIWKQGHFTAINANKGVFKYEGMFEVNNGGVPIGPDELKECANIEDEGDFISNFEVGVAEEVEGRSGGVTGSKKFVYAITKRGKRIPIMEKRQRSKNGILGKLNSVYGWSKDMQNCFDSND